MGTLSLLILALPLALATATSFTVSATYDNELNAISHPLPYTVQSPPPPNSLFFLRPYPCPCTLPPPLSPPQPPLPTYFAHLLIFIFAHFFLELLIFNLFAHFKFDCIFLMSIKLIKPKLLIQLKKYQRSKSNQINN